MRNFERRLRELEKKVFKESVPWVAVRTKNEPKPEARIIITITETKKPENEETDSPLA